MSMFPAGKRSHVGDTRHDEAGAKHYFEVETPLTPTRREKDVDGDIDMEAEQTVLETVGEGNGIVHLCQAWPPQGHGDVSLQMSFGRTS